MKKIKLLISKFFEGNRIIYFYVASGAAVFVGILIIILCGWIRMVDEYENIYSQESMQEDVPNFGTQKSEPMREENVPNSGTTIHITNLEEIAVPILNERASELEIELSEYVKNNQLEECESAIIHIAIPEQNTKQIFFFCKFQHSEEIVQVVMDRKKEVFVTLKSIYTEEELLNEIWNGERPLYRDIQE